MRDSSSFANRRGVLVEAVAPWAAGIVLGAPVLLAYYPPMTDLAFHEAAIGILRHFDDDSMFPPGLYQHNLGEPNQLFHMLGWALSYLVSTRWAVKLVVSATIVAIPVCAARFARRLGASPLASLVVAPMAVGWLFSWGLVANLLGLAALLAMLPLLDGLAERPSARRALAAAGGLLLLYFAHAAMLIVYAGAALGFAALRADRSLSRALWRLSPVAGGALLVVAQGRWQQRFMTPTVRAMPMLWHPVWHKIKRIPYIILPINEGPVKIAMFGLCLLVIASFLWLRARERRIVRGQPPASRFERIRARALAARWELFALACFAAYLVFPLTLGGATLVYERFFPPAYAVFTLAVAPRNLWTRTARATTGALAALPIATLFAVWPAFVDSNREYRALERLIPLVEPGSAVANIDLGPGDPSRLYSLGPASGRILATRGGRLAYAFTDSPISPVVLARRYQWNESLVRIGFDGWSFRPAHDLQRFRYVLLHTNDPQLSWLATYSLQTETDLVAESGDWVLLRSKLPTVPLTSRDVRLEKPPPESLRDRINKVVAALRGDAPPVEVPPEPCAGSEDSTRADGEEGARDGRPGE